MRPVALIRGMAVKARVVAVGSRWTALCSSRASTPGRPPWPMSRSPAFTMVRFSPSKGTTSPMVPRAARSAYSSRMPWLSPSSNAVRSFNTTPAPERSLQGLWSPGWWASIRAAASGRLSWGRWWSVITTSMPSSRARATSSREEIPLSTVMMSFTPSWWRVSTAWRFMP